MAKQKLRIEIDFLDGLVVQTVPRQPHAVWVTNHLGSTIVAYTLHYAGETKTGEKSTYYRLFSNLGIGNDVHEIPPGTTRLAVPYAPGRPTLPIDPDDKYRWLTFFRAQSVITVSVDLVILESGKVLGPDKLGTQGKLQRVLNAKTEAFSIAQSLLANDLDIEQIRSELRRRSREGDQELSFYLLDYIYFARRSKELLLEHVARAEANLPSISFYR